MFTRRILALSIFSLVAMTGSSAFANYDEINVVNETDRHIWVAVRYEPYGGDGFITDGWWHLAPGETAYIVDSINSDIYFHAHDDHGNVWGGDHQFRFERETLSFACANTGPDWLVYYYSFSE